MKEIGSEFSRIDWNVSNKILNHKFDEGTLVFSGRTAIEIVLKNEASLRKAMLPSYCCDSMIEPFRRAEISVCFYPVTYDNGLKIDLTIPDDVDCLLWCNYFGFQHDMPDISDFLKRDGIVIEDITHSLYSKQHHWQSHYLVASVRKWEPILCGGYCASRKGSLTNLPSTEPILEFLEQKEEAMRLKADFLNGDSSISKNTFLQMFSQNNKWLAEQYNGLTIDNFSKEYLLNMNYLAHYEARRRNAEILYNQLKDCRNFQFLFEQSDIDCPLFVPIIIEQGKRDAVRKELIEHQIYCPIHWPKPNAECESNLYDIELSLVCDQRYDADDMYRISSVLQNL